jgi:uncharacterized protein YjbJ (UPF0337 family)
MMLFRLLVQQGIVSSSRHCETCIKVALDRCATSGRHEKWNSCSQPPVNFSVETGHVFLTGRKLMSGTSDKIKGLANEAIGNVKQGVGKVTGNEKLQVEGAVQEKKGEAQQVVGKVKDAVDKK